MLCRKCGNVFYRYIGAATGLAGRGGKGLSVFGLRDFKYWRPGPYSKGLGIWSVDGHFYLKFY